MDKANMSILVSDFQCTGSEGTLAACNHTNTSIDCGHQQDVGINLHHMSAWEHCGAWRE